MSYISKWKIDSVRDVDTYLACSWIKELDFDFSTGFLGMSALRGGLNRSRHSVEGGKGGEVKLFRIFAGVLANSGELDAALLSTLGFNSNSIFMLAVYELS